MGFSRVAKSKLPQSVIIYLFIAYLFRRRPAPRLSCKKKIARANSRDSIMSRLLFPSQRSLFKYEKKVPGAQPEAQSSEDAGYNSISSRVP